ncbi:unnamed protein product [Caenorhabditis auriculariae]|uniref:Protein sleepless n=1 Tax=Caenorhabditis auriculariae TaxID=2777116 RepID=A0A8S1HDD8_9PELO|nr:unnamed protein product [Caenorhabditis auriculariae]
MHVLSLCVLASIVVATSSLSCYICNSLMQSDCEDNYQQFLRPCPVKSFGGQKAVKPIACRVSRQYISDEYSIVRECAYTGEDVVGKSNKGSMGGLASFLTVLGQARLQLGRFPDLLPHCFCVIVFFPLPFLLNSPLSKRSIFPSLNNFKKGLHSPVIS